MNDFQFYEFQALDKSLTADQQISLSYLSQNPLINEQQAIFTYSYGDLPRQPEDLVARLFDAMLYLSTWGSKQLLFRFAHSAVNVAVIEPYLVAHRIKLEQDGLYFVLSLNLGEDDTVEWIDGEGELSRLTPLRRDLMAGDTRMLYLAWLKMVELREITSNTVEPCIPTGLDTLTAPLRHFINLFEIDSALLAAAARPTEKPRTVKELRKIAEQEILRAREWYLNNIVQQIAAKNYR